MFSQGHKHTKVKQCFDRNVSVPKDHLLSRGHILLSVSWPWSSPLVPFMFYPGNCSGLNSHNAGKTFPSLLKIVYRLPFSLCIFFFFLLHSFSLEPLGIFLFTLDQFRRCFFLLFLGQALLFQACGYDSCFLYCAWPSHCVWQLFNCRHSPRHTLSACVVGWVALHYSRGYTHTHTCIHAGWVLYRNGIV